MARLQLLVPLDGTDFSKQILPQVEKLFAPDHWALRLLHVAQLPVDPAAAAAYGPAAVGPDYRLYMYGYEYPAAGLHPVYEEDDLEDFRRSLEADLEDELELFRAEGYEVSATVHFGDPVDEITAFADEEGVDLIAMATHDRHGLQRLLQGSVARSVLDRAAVPVLMLRGTAEARRSRRRDDAVTEPELADPGERRRADDERGRDPGAHLPAAAHDHAQRSDDQVVTPADTYPATLGGQPGRGVLTLTWDDSGELHEGRGSFFPDDPDEAALAALEGAERDGRTLLYDGRAVDSETAGHDDDHPENVRREVRVTGVRSYQDYEGRTRTLVSFELAAGPGAAIDVPEQYSKPDFERLDLRTIAELTGLEPPAERGGPEEARYRERAYESYKIDVSHRDQWGTARQSGPLPSGE